jgi:UDP-glucose 4-epimerase
VKENINSQIFLVTGGFGFIGRNIALQASSLGASVIGLGNGLWTKEESSSWGFKDWKTCEITLSNLILYGGKPDVIIHCASGSSVSYSIKQPYVDFERSVNSLINVLEFIRLHSPNTRLVLTSSASVYGISTNFPITIYEALKPLSTYGVYKKIAEELCIMYSNEFKIKSSIVRLFSVYGSGLKKQLLWDACNKIIMKDFIFAGTGNESRDWIHVDDAVKLLILASSYADYSVPIVNGGTGNAVKVNQILTIIFEKLSKNSNVIFSGNSRKGDPQCYQADITEAKNWGWEPTRFWRDGILEYVDWYTINFILK